MPRPRPQLTLPELQAEVARLEAKYDFEMKPFRVEYDASRNDELRYQIIDKDGDGWVGRTPHEVLGQLKETIHRWFGDMNPNGSSVFRRTHAEAADDGKRFLATTRKEPASDKAVADARFSPGEEPKRFARAKPKSDPTTPLEHQLVQEVAAGAVALGLWSNALLYSPALRHLSVRERQALYSLVKGGAIGMVRAYPPDEYWLAREQRHTPNAGYYVWVMGRSDEPLDEPALGPHDLQTAKTMARIAATNGVHDRVVSHGLSPLSDSFEIVRRYRAHTGERVI